MNSFEVTQLLEAASRWRTLRLEGTEWRDPAVQEAAAAAHGKRVAAAGVLAARVTLQSKSSGPGGPATERWLFCHESSGRIRAEYMVGDQLVRVAFRGDDWISDGGIFGRTSSDEDRDEVLKRAGLPPIKSHGPVASHHRPGHGKGPGGLLALQARELPACIVFDHVADSSWLDRQAVEVHGHPGPDPEHLHHHLKFGYGADSFRFLVDRDLGILLRLEARAEDKPFRVIEVESIAVDQDLDGRLFTDLSPVLSGPDLAGGGAGADRQDHK